MANMSYCRFQNTLGDLIDCQNALFDYEKLSEEEYKAAKKLLSVCQNIVDSVDEDDIIKEEEEEDN
jgi:hypothetical protein